MNGKNPHFFFKGMQANLDDHIKDKETYTLGTNGRVFMQNGEMAFTSVKGTTTIYQNPNIAKYLGTFVFKDVVVVFAKCTGYPINNSGIIYQTEEIDIVIAKNFDVQLSSGSLLFSNQFTLNHVESTYTQNTQIPAPPSDIDLADNYSPDDVSEETIDLSSYYALKVNVPSFGSCPNETFATPANNTDYADCIITLQYDDSGELFEKLHWSGYQNWSINSKIIALGVEENSNYMRVKYTDNINPFRSINLYDSKLASRSAKELNNFQSTILLQPRISAIEELGQLRVMAAQYYYRLITENGQVTEFSPASEVVYITPSDLVAFSGGGIEEYTNKSVKITCNIVDSSNFNEIELIAAEYEANAGVPTNIKSLGIQKVGEVNVFNHYGSEGNFTTSTTLADLIASQVNWKYCSDMVAKNNKLIVAGLRNDPISSDFNSLKYNFALHGWKANGETHSSFLNPDPELYNKIPIGYAEDLFYVKKKVYTSIKIFQTAIVTFGTLTLGVSNNDNFYINQTETIAAWLLDEQANNVDFATLFPNLLIELTSGSIVMKPIDDLIKTDFNDYKFTYDTTQVIEDSDDEVIFDNDPITTFPMVDGALSAGFNKGTGIRITYRLVQEELITKASARYTGTGKIVDFKDPSFNKTLVKDEIYRLGVHMYKDGEQIFVVPMGDIKIPGLGDSYHYLDDNNNAIFSTDKYVNQKVIGNKLYGMRVELRCEVRLDCSKSKNIDMYRIMYVERTENNRTVLAQGLAAPLLRVQDPERYLRSSIWEFNEKLQNKWMLPYYGGPTYDKLGFSEFDAVGDVNLDTYVWQKRVLNDRSLMYLDCPDIIYGNTSESLISSCSLKVVGRLNTDETGAVIMESGEPLTTNTGPKSNMASSFGSEVYPKFSRKITSKYLKIGVEDAETDLPWHVRDGKNDDGTVQTHFVNVSVFANYTPFSSEHSIQGHVSLAPGEIIPGTELNTSFDLSNNAMCLPSMPWWYSAAVRKVEESDDENQYQAMLASLPSKGEKTLFIRSETDLFTDSFIGPVTLPRPDSQIVFGSDKLVDIYDSHALINLKRSNAISIYGGRSELAFTKNSYIPLSETIPVEKSTNGSQTFMVQGDAYVTLYLRTKNSKSDDEEFFEDGNGPKGHKLNNGRTNGDEDYSDIENLYVLNGAWCYGVVLESMIEPKLNHEYEFYRENKNIDFYQVKDEVLNSAYEVKNNSKTFIPQPFRFKDDPLLTNILAASEVKSSGDYYDAWASFLVNEFQELDKDKGACFNLVKFKDQVFAIQEIQTNMVNIDRDTMIPTTDGTALNVKQGSGKSIDGYSVYSPYGTSIRRSVVKNDTYGFSFIDETENLLIKMDQPLTIQNQYHFDFFNSMKEDPIVDVEAFFDKEHHESGWQIKQASGLSRALTYGEKTKALNGYYDYDSSLYFSFKSMLFAPLHTITEGVHSSSKLLLLNSGVPLEYFEQQRKMSITFVSSSGVDTVTIFKHISMIVGKNTTIEKMVLETKQGHQRTILREHWRFLVREGIHSVPLLNNWFDGISEEETWPLRSEFVKVTIFFPYTGEEQKIVSAILDTRKSFI